MTCAAIPDQGGRRLPSLGAITRTNAIIGTLASAALFYLRTPLAALSCALAVAVVIGNLYLLAGLVRAILDGAATGGAGGWGAIALPLKLLLIAGLVYLLLRGAHLDALGFAAGVLTQMAAVGLETARWRWLGAPSGAHRPA